MGAEAGWEGRGEGVRVRIIAESLSKSLPIAVSDFHKHHCSQCSQLMRPRL